MIIEEPVTTTSMRKVLRCDKCCKAIYDTYDKQHMTVVEFHRWSAGKAVNDGRYHLCEQCAFSLKYDYDTHRKRIQEGVTPIEQEALLLDLFTDRKKRRRNDKRA